MTVQATTSYSSSNPTVAPPGPTTVSNTVTVPAPSSVAKGGGVGAPMVAGEAIWVTDPVTAGGRAIGSFFAGQVQENIAAVTSVSGLTFEGTGGWWPALGDGQATFFLSGLDSNLHDRFLYDDPDWATIPAGELLSFTQGLQVTWAMPTAGGGSQVFTASLGSLSWKWSKVDADHWEVD